MFKDKSGTEWTSEEKYKIFDKNYAFIFNSALALECYTDENGIEDDEILEAYNDCMFLRRNFVTEDDLLKETERLLEVFNTIFDRVGREKFIFYKDGDVNYIWKTNMEGGKKK